MLHLSRHYNNLQLDRHLSGRRSNRCMVFSPPRPLCPRNFLGHVSSLTYTSVTDFMAVFWCSLRCIVQWFALSACHRHTRPSPRVAITSSLYCLPPFLPHVPCHRLSLLVDVQAAKMCNVLENRNLPDSIISSEPASPCNQGPMN